VTLETLEPKFDKVIPEFNGMLTFLAYRRACGTEALAYRSAAGVIRQCPVFCLPGQTSLIKVGTEQLIIPEVHLIKSEISKS
jgi:molybdenum cofactor synthesis domain protein